MYYIRTKRIISFALSLIMMASFCMLSVGATKAQTKETSLATAIADITETSTLTQMQQAQASEEVLLLAEKAYFDLNRLEIDSVDENGNVVYTYQVLDGLTAYLTVNEEADGTLTVVTEENGNINTMQFAADGKLLVEGGEVTLTSQDQQTLETHSINLSPRAGAYSYFGSVCPGNTSPGQYTGSPILYNNTQLLEFTVAVAKLNVTVMANAICKMMSPVWGSDLADIAEEMGHNFIDRCVASEPYSKAVSFKDYRIARTGNNTLASYYRHDVYFYAKANYQGYSWLEYSYYESRLAT